MAHRIELTPEIKRIEQLEKALDLILKALQELAIHIRMNTDYSYLEKFETFVYEMEQSKRWEKERKGY
jgi:hypothetical protein